MKLLKKTAAGLLLTLGLTILVMAADKLRDENTPALDKEELKATIGFLGLPLTVEGGLLAWGLHQEGKKEKEREEKELRDRIHSIFYQLLETRKGQITVMHLARSARLSGKEAQQFLDEKAKEFNATFDVSERGDVYYYFEI